VSRKQKKIIDPAKGQDFISRAEYSNKSEPVIVNEESYSTVVTVTRKGREGHTTSIQAAIVIPFFFFFFLLT
jgi:hypothetical protein